MASIAPKYCDPTSNGVGWFPAPREKHPDWPLSLPIGPLDVQWRYYDCGQFSVFPGYTLNKANRFLVFTWVWLLLFTLAACSAEPAANEDQTIPPASATATIAGQGKAAAAIAPPAPDPVLEELRRTVVPVRDLRNLTVRLRPEVDSVPEVVNETTPEFAVGDRQRFWVHDLRTTTYRETTAELIYKTPVAYAWVEVDQPANREAIIQAIDRFSTQSYPAEVALFGHEWNPGVDNDPRLHILHSTGTGAGVAGYYYSADEYSRLANPYSNEKELFYINLEWLNTTADYEYYETVLAHEFQHMIHWHNDSNERAWVNEGLSEYAQEVTGFGTADIFVNAFVNNPDTQLNSWNLDPVGNATHYGASYLFIHYLQQRFGSQTLTNLVAQPSNGIEGIQATLTEQGTDLTFDQLFADWAVANYANQFDALDGDGKYGYAGLDFPKPISEQSFTDYPAAPYRSTVNNYATDYLRLDGSGNLALHFSGQTTTTLAAVQLYNGAFSYWSNNSDSSDTRLTRQFDLSNLTPGTPVMMDVAMWWDIEEHYDYAYVSASRDGRKWAILPGQRTVTDNPVGNSFGAGYTGKSEPNAAGDAQWVDESYELSAYAGAPVWVRFEYVTDDGITGPGWFIDEVRIPALDYATGFENDTGGFESEGWLRTDNRLPQRWLLQLLTLDGDNLVDRQFVATSSNGQAHFDVNALGANRRAVLAISAVTPVTTQPATYELVMSEQ